MKRLIAVALTLALGTGGAQAHHSRAPFDLTKDKVLKVRITEVRWTNPHVFYVGELVNDKGQKEEWTFEGHSIAGLTHLGWTKETLQKGDEVEMTVNPFRESDKRFALIDHVRMGDGRVMYSIGQPPSPAAQAPVQPSTDFTGNWQFRFPGTPEQVRQRVLLGAGGPPKDLPYTEKALAQVAAYDPLKHPALTCEPLGLPSLLMTVYEYKWSRSADRVVIRKEHYEEATRVIYLKTTTPPSGYKPNPVGFSTGRFEPDGTFVVETTRFSPLRWGNGIGVDSSDKKRIVERYKLIDGGMGLSLSYTLEDPVYFTKPVTREGVFFKKADSEFVQQPPCDLGAAQQHLKFEK
ncbi:MAG: DUF6152 family protein [Steroidobacteraceae bacterium]